MMRTDLRLPFRILTLLMVVVGVSAGCAPSRTERQHSLRYEHMRDWWEEYAVRGEEPIDNMDWLDELTDQLRTHHNDELDATLKQARSSYKSDPRLWDSKPRKRRSWWDKLWGRNPEPSAQPPKGPNF